MGIMFAPDMLALVLSGKKTQTRRKVNKADAIDEYQLDIHQSDIVNVFTAHDGVYAVFVVGTKTRQCAYRVTRAKCGLVYRNNRAYWRVGNTYAVQPKRGKPTAYYKNNPDGTISYYDFASGQRVQGAKARRSLALSEGYAEGRIRLTAIRLERFCDISQADAIAEGFADSAGFHAKIRELYGDDFDLSQPCWCLEFSLVTPT